MEPLKLSTRRDVYRQITDHIIAAIEVGAPAFKMPWHRQGTSVTRPINASTRKPYHGINVVALWVAGEAAGFDQGVWATYRQWQSLNAQVRRGERATLVVFYRKLEPEAEPGVEETKPRLVVRASWVFNAAQVDGWHEPQRARRDPVERLREVERFVAATQATVCEGGTRACYLPVPDTIAMPDRWRFAGTETINPTESFYATLLHELVHWSAHAKRLNRDLSGRFGDASYAMEELVAELGAAFLCADLSVTNAPRPDHAAYVASWLAVLKRDTKAIFTAASQASRAASYLDGLQLGRSRQEIEAYAELEE